MFSRSKSTGALWRSVLGLTVAACAVAAAPAGGQACATPALGCWAQLPNPEVTSVNAIALKNGKVMLQNRGFTANQQLYQLYDPATDTFSPSPPAQASVAHNMYCSGFDQTGENGDVLFAGGLSGDDRGRASVYSPATDTWTAKPDMKALRFYPTVITLSKHEVLAIDGSGSVPESNIPESYGIGGMTWSSLYGAEYGLGLNNNFELPNYPRSHVLSTGEVIYTGSEQFVPTGGDATLLLDPVFETWRQPFAAADPITGDSGVMYDLDTIMKAGEDIETWTLEATTPGAQWTRRADMNQTRHHFFLVALADGNVLAVGDVVTPEIYDVANDTWTNGAPASVARGDHSSAVLLPDGRVLHAGPTLTAEVFSPPYLFNNSGGFARRPDIASVTGPSAGVIQYGESFKVVSKRAVFIDEIRLIRLGGATHSWDMGQQSMELSFAPTCCDPDEMPGVNGNPLCIEGATCCGDGVWRCNKGDGSPDCPLLAEEVPASVAKAAQQEPVELLPAQNLCRSLAVEAPQHPYQSPPGYHYLFLIEDGVPSKASIVQAVVCP